jgi:type II secretory pathway component PulK
MRVPFSSFVGREPELQSFLTYTKDDKAIETMRIHVPRARRGGDRGGIALLVVLIVFVVLFLVVYQLHFTTSMEERLAEVRYGEVESDVAQHSIARFVLTLLLEDLQQASGASTATGSAAGALPGGASDQGGSRGPAPPGTNPEAGAQGGTEGNFVPAAGAVAAAGSKWWDYYLENVFNPQVKSIGNTSVKVTIVDGERKFDLNRLFDYIRLPDEDLEVLGALGDVREEDLVDAVQGAASEEEATERLRDRLLLTSRTRREGTERSRATRGGASGADSGDGARAGAADGARGRASAGPRAVGADGLEEEGTESDYDPEPVFERPADERIEATVEMVRRAVLMMLSINEDAGYRYASTYQSERVAREIVEYVLERRMSPVQNRIYLASELLNLSSVTPELFYGPVPDLIEGEEREMGDFVLRRDEYGDVVSEYLYGEALDAEGQLQIDEELRGLESEYGRFMDFPPGLGLGRLASNALTRGMTEPSIGIDEEGMEYVIDPPKPLGLRDVFTTFSTGRVNLNTASVPVLFALLSSCTEEEAKVVAHDIAYYRTRFQEEMPAEDADGGAGAVNDRQTPDLGQPRRPPRTEEEEELQDGSYSGALGSGALGSGALGAQGTFDPLAMDSLEAFAPYENLETNYFTDLRQIELVDGTDGGPADLLSSDEGVQKVSVEDDTLLRRVIRDYEKTVVFGSTYFDVELKAKMEKSRSVKTSYVTVRRDPEKGMMEIVMWKALEK